MDRKICSWCKKSYQKTKRFFQVKRNNADGLDEQCKQCRSSLFKHWFSSGIYCYDYGRYRALVVTGESSPHDCMACPLKTHPRQIPGNLTKPGIMETNCMMYKSVKRILMMIGPPTRKDREDAN